MLYGARETNAIWPRDRSKPSPMAKLPEEILVEIIRFAVSKDKPIPMLNFEVWLMPLVAPFSALATLFQIAWREAIRVNIFFLDFRRQPDEDPDPFDPPKLIFPDRLGAGVLAPLRQPWGLNLMEHLHIHLNILLFSGHYVDDEDLFATGWDPETVTLFRTLHEKFSRLQTLFVQVENRGIECPRGWEGEEVYNSYTVEGQEVHPGSPFYWKCQRMERRLHMLKILLLVADVTSPPRLRSKIVSFPFLAPPPPPPSKLIIRDPAPPVMPVTPVDCGYFWNMPYSSYPGMEEANESSFEQEARVALLFRNLVHGFKGTMDPEVLRPETWSRARSWDIEELYRRGVGEQDDRMLEMLLRFKGVGVVMPC